jgi:SAM-dependent methyltransferase
MSTHPTDPESRVQWVYSSDNSDEVRARYDARAEQYDADLTEVYDYALPTITVDDFVRHIDASARVLDGGSGTGLVGMILQSRGFRSIVGINISQGMLAVADRTGVYSETRQMTLGEPLDFEAGIFDAVISVGTFTAGHAPAIGLIELARVTRPGGVLVIAIRDDIIESHGFGEVIKSLTDTQTVRLLELTDPKVAMPKTEPDLTVQSWCFEV